MTRRRRSSKKDDPVTESHINGEIVEDVPVTETTSDNVSDDDAKEKTGNAPAIRHPRRLTLTSYSPLQIAQTANYLRYGRYGVRRFGPGAPVEHATHTQTITIMLSLKQATDKILLKIESLTLRNPHPETPFDLEGTNIWVGEQSDAHLQVMWVWDFYRLHSGLQISLELPPEDIQPGTWQEASIALRSLEAGDQVIVEAASRAGNILQIYPVDAGAFSQ